MGTVSQASRNMKAFVIVVLVAAVSGEADPYTIGQVLAGQTNGGVLTSTTYHGGVKVAGFPYTKVALGEGTREQTQGSSSGTTIQLATASLGSLVGSERLRSPTLFLEPMWLNRIIVH